MRFTPHCAIPGCNHNTLTSTVFPVLACNTSFYITSISSTPFEMSDSEIDAAMNRLVSAMLGHEDPVAASLGRRVLTSQIGSSEDDILDVTSTWRRMARKSPDAQCAADVTALYEQLQALTPAHLPPKILTVLTKLMGKNLQLPDATIHTSTRGSSSNTRSDHGTAESTPSVSSSQFQQPVRVNYGATPSARSTFGGSSVRTSNTMGHPANAVPSAPPQQAALRPQHDNRQAPPTQHQVEEQKRALEQEESLLLRECLYSLQGIDGDRIRYHHKENTQQNSSLDPLSDYDGIRIQSSALSHNLLYTGRVLETRLGTGAMDALRICGEAGWFYKRIQSNIQEAQQDQSKGVVGRAFAGTLVEELREYHSLLTQYESQLANLSLRQLLVDLRLPTSRLQILAVLTDGLQHLSGGNLLSGLYRHTLHGDSRHSQLARKLLCSASRPWFDILFTWTTQGVLSDPHGEFFVTEIASVEDRHLWNDKYRVNREQIPEGVLSKELVGPIFNVGKGINFIRRCLLDSRWSMHLDGSLEEEDDTVTTGGGDSEQLGFVYRPQEDDNLALERTLGRAATLVHSHILLTLREDNRMVQHLFALKQFLFLGQGDFFSALMDGLHSGFRDRPSIVGIYKHSLLSIVENALRSTNARYLPQFVLDRLQVELLVDPDDTIYGMFGQSKKDENNDTRTVWDIFMLDYQVPDPLRAIVNPRKVEQYKRVFSLLFGLRRIEFMINFTWRQSATLQHALQTYGQHNGINVKNNPMYAQALSFLRKISILRQNMIHLIVNLKSYFMFEVVEGGWQRLQSDIEAATTLDDVIDAHDYYIDGIVRKSLLRSGDKDDALQQQLADHVQILLQITDDFCNFQEEIFHESLAMADVATQKRIEADRRVREGQWGFDSERDIAEEENFFGLVDIEKSQEVDRISSIYNDHTLHLLRVLNDRVNTNPDELKPESNTEDENDLTYFGINRRRKLLAVAEDDLDSQRFLIAQLDHNNYYSVQGALP